MSKKPAILSRRRKVAIGKFEPSVIRRARAAAKRLGRISVFDRESESFIVRCVEMPRVIGAGSTASAAERSFDGVLEFTLACMIEAGESIPEPAEEPRQAQFNIRVSESERVTFEAAAKRLGLSSVADLLRLSAKEKLRAIGM